MISQVAVAVSTGQPLNRFRLADACFFFSSRRRHTRLTCDWKFRRVLFRSEIALDLATAGVDVALAVRGPVQILPRDLLGFPILAWAILYRRLPARLVDAINAPILRLAVGRIEKLGLRRAAKGPRQMVEEDGRVPLIDIG